MFYNVNTCDKYWIIGVYHCLFEVISKGHRGATMYSLILPIKNKAQKINNTYVKQIAP